MRLIDADTLKKDIMSYKTMPEIRKAICEVIDNAPTIMDLRPRPQGKWIYHKGDGYFLPTMECSQCHERDLLGDLTPKLYKDYYKICFRCGADMRGGKE